MSVYVDNPRHSYGRMVMCHMLADTSDELHAMAEKIGVDRKWCQNEGTYREHYDICKSKRALAIEHGAIPAKHPTIGFLLSAKRYAAAPRPEERPE